MHTDSPDEVELLNAEVIGDTVDDVHLRGGEVEGFLEGRAIDAPSWVVSRGMLGEVKRAVLIPYSAEEQGGLTEVLLGGMVTEGTLEGVVLLFGQAPSVAHGALDFLQEGTREVAYQAVGALLGGRVVIEGEGLSGSASICSTKRRASWRASWGTTGRG